MAGTLERMLSGTALLQCITEARVLFKCSLQDSTGLGGALN